MAQNDIYRVTAQFTTTEGDIFQWVWHYQQTTGGSPTPQEISDGIQVMLDDAYPDLAQWTHTSVTGDTLDIALWDSVQGVWNSIIIDSISQYVGLAGGNGPANFQDAPVVKFFTNVGRSIGKKFIFGLVQTAFNSQSPVALVLADMALFAVAFVVNVTAGADTLQGGNFNAGTGIFRPWTGTVGINILTGTQDRRRRGIGL